MKKSFAALTAVLILSPLANAHSYNQCPKPGDSSSGIYFESGEERPTPNASEHDFERVTVVTDGKRLPFKIGGDGLYDADCQMQPGGTSSLTLNRQAYLKMDKKFLCSDGKTFVEIKFDASVTGEQNGTVSGLAADGTKFSLAIKCPQLQ